MDGSIFPLYAAVGAFASSTAVACYGWHRAVKLAKAQIASAHEAFDFRAKYVARIHLLGFRKTLKDWTADAKANKRKHSHYLEEIDRLSTQIEQINASWES